MLLGPSHFFRSLTDFEKTHYPSSLLRKCLNLQNYKTENVTGGLLLKSFIERNVCALGNINDEYLLFKVTTSQRRVTNLLQRKRAFSTKVSLEQILLIYVSIKACLQFYLNSKSYTLKT